MKLPTILTKEWIVLRKILALIIAILALALLLRFLPAHAAEWPDQASVRSYIISEANRYNFPSSKALFVVEKESGFGWRGGIFNPKVRGDWNEKLGRYCSYGIWQINLCVHKDITIKQADDIEKSTQWAMRHLVYEPWIWSTFARAKDWYVDFAGIF